jgi:pheromone shutdown protein TraB
MSNTTTFTSPTDIEKESLEAHVELCAQRYDSMKGNMERMEDRLTNLEVMVKQIKDMLVEKENSAYKKLLSIGFTIIGSLLTTLLGLGIYFMKMPH